MNNAEVPRTTNHRAEFLSRYSRAFTAANSNQRSPAYQWESGWFVQRWADLDSVKERVRAAELERRCEVLKRRVAGADA